MVIGLRHTYAYGASLFCVDIEAFEAQEPVFAGEIISSCREKGNSLEEFVIGKSLNLLTA